jgi:hypothetical protein
MVVRRPLGAFLGALAAIVLAMLPIAAAGQPATAKERIASLMPLWRAAAPLCDGAPSSANCADGDMTLFNGLLCAAGDALGCQSVKGAQDKNGRWHRSVRLARDPTVRPHNSFSWDMALGVQLYAVTTRDVGSFERWLQWIENARPCLVESPKVQGVQACLVRGWPRWCTDDTENGCMAKPQNLATLAMTVERLSAKVPEPSRPRVPGGVAGQILGPLVERAADANETFSLKRLLGDTRPLHPMTVVADAGVNREGYPRHLVAVEIMLARLLGTRSDEIDRAATILLLKEPANPFFRYLAEGPSDAVAARVLDLAPKSDDQLPVHRSEWTWQRASTDEAWRNANLWDFVFMGDLLAHPGASRSP